MRLLGLAAYPRRARVAARGGAFGSRVAVRQAFALLRPRSVVGGSAANDVDSDAESVSSSDAPPPLTDSSSDEAPLDRASGGGESGEESSADDAVSLSSWFGSSAGASFDSSARLSRGNGCLASDGGCSSSSASSSDGFVQFGWANKCLQTAILRLCSGKLRHSALRYFRSTCANDARGGLGENAVERANFFAGLAFLDDVDMFVGFTTQTNVKLVRRGGWVPRARLV